MVYQMDYYNISTLVYFLTKRVHHAIYSLISVKGIFVTRWRRESNTRNSLKWQLNLT